MTSGRFLLNSPSHKYTVDIAVPQSIAGRDNWTLTASSSVYLLQQTTRLCIFKSVYPTSLLFYMGQQPISVLVPNCKNYSATSGLNLSRLEMWFFFVPLGRLTLVGLSPILWQSRSLISSQTLFLSSIDRLVEMKMHFSTCDNLVMSRIHSNSADIL